QPHDDGTAFHSGSPGPASSRQVLGVVLDSVLHQKLPEFLGEGPLAMMLFLCGDILAHRLHPAGADCEYRITLLPLKLTLLVSRRPHRRRLLELAHKIREAMYGLKPNEGVDMIRNSADLERHACKAADGSAQIFVESWAPIWLDKGAAFFGGTDPVVMQVVIGRTHGKKMPVQYSGATSI